MEFVLVGFKTMSISCMLHSNQVGPGTMQEQDIMWLCCFAHVPGIWD